MLPQNIHIGYVGEINARPFPFDIRELLERWPDATPSISYRRAGKGQVAYEPRQTKREGTVLIWLPIEEDLQYEGWGECQIIMKDAEKNIIGRSHVMPVNVAHSVINGAEPPEYIRPFEEEMRALAVHVDEVASRVDELKEQTADIRDEAADARDEAQKARDEARRMIDEEIVSPTVRTERTADGWHIVITDKDGVHELNLHNGVDGKDGISPTVEMVRADNGIIIRITDKDGVHEALLRDGTNGSDGISPTATVERVADGLKITITDKDGTHEAVVRDGKNGEDGTSPAVSIFPAENGILVRIIDKDGVHEGFVRNGTDGTDYVLTEADKEEIAGKVDLSGVATKAETGALADLKTVAKGNLVAAINENKSGLDDAKNTLNQLASSVGNLVFRVTEDGLLNVSEKGEQ